MYEEGAAMNGNFGVGWWARCRKGIVRFSLLIVACVVLMFLGSRQSGTVFGVEGTLNPNQITREYTYDAWQDVPDIEQRITDEDGTVYLLREISSPVPATGGIPEKQFTVMAQRPITPETESQGRAAIQSLFARALSLDVGDYAGILRIQTLTTEPVYRSVEEQVERTIVYPDLASEDVLQLPEYESFTVTSDEDLEATVTQSLKRVAVSWTTTGFDGDGRPNQHEATVVFRGVQRQLMIDYHVATVTYSGTVPAKSYDATIVATYESESASEVAPAPVIRPLTSSDSTTLSETPAPLSAPTPSPLPFITAAIVVVVMLLALLLLLYFLLYSNARLVQISSTGARKVLVRRHLRLAKGEATFKIDPSFELYREGECHLIVLGRRLAVRTGHLVVLWGNQLILRSELKRVVDVTEELIHVLGYEAGTLAQGEAQAAFELSRNRGGSRGSAGGGDFHKTAGNSP
jgi:hypothetical protein